MSALRALINASLSHCPNTDPDPELRLFWPRQIDYRSDARLLGGTLYKRGRAKSYTFGARPWAQRFFTLDLDAGLLCYYESQVNTPLIFLSFPIFVILFLPSSLSIYLSIYLYLSHKHTHMYVCMCTYTRRARWSEDICPEAGCRFRVRGSRT